MLAEIAHFALAIALALSLVQMVIPVWGVRRNDMALARVGEPAAIGVFALLLFAFSVLTYGYAVSDFSIQNVAENSHSAKPFIYKLTGTWGNHEGSMLLWVLILALFGALVAVARKSTPDRLRAGALAAQGSITVAFLLFILFTSNPFNRLDPAPPEGNDLNPLLQDLGLAIHPPLLYVGYVGFSITYAFAIAALIDGRIDAVWARAVRPWTLTAWAFLTLGISMGSYWAYYELGWGGWWFWDPVENASLMPWLAGTALIHSTIVMEKRDSLKVWTILLAIMTFSLSLLGTFLVRSGVLTSVHTFATDPSRGLFILIILLLFIGGSLALFAWRAPMLRQGGLFAPVSREGALVVNNLFLAVACGAVFIGTLYPLALEGLTGAKISVGPPFFNATFLPLLIPLLLLLPFGQSMAWKRGDLLGTAQRLATSIIVGVAATVLIFAFTYGGPVAAPLGIGLGVFLIASAIWDLGERVVGRASGAGAIWSRAVGLPRSAYGTAIAHAGVGVTVIGIAATAWATEDIAILKPGDRLANGNTAIVMQQVFPRTGPNYREVVGRFVVEIDGKSRGTVDSMKRTFITRNNMQTTEAGIRTFGFSQVYVSLGEIQPDGSLGVRLYTKPLMLLIWIGTLIMALGAFLSLTDRRFRVATPAKARAPARAGARDGPSAQPAE
jgi:cytochrome c-type biogenesis protein CcmF